MTKKYKKFLLVSIALIIIIAAISADGLGLFDIAYAKLGLDGKCDYDYVKFLDVGQGDCTLIHSNGKYVLVDSGCNFDDGIAVVKKLKSYNVRQIDYIIVSHDHSDHAGGIYKILSDFSVGAVVCSNGAFRDTDETLTQNVLSVADERVVPIITANAGDSLVLESAAFDFLWLNESKDENDSSLVFKLTLGGKSFFFGGDISAAVEKRILKACIDVSCDVLKASHHGSSTGNSEEFLDALKPAYCVVSCGVDNIYGFPSAKFLERTKERNISVFVTATHGDITFNTDENTFWTKK